MKTPTQMIIESVERMPPLLAKEGCGAKLSDDEIATRAGAAANAATTSEAETLG